MAIRFCFVIFCSFVIFTYTDNADAQSVGAYDLINLINGMRSGNGLGALSVDSSLMACAQSTAETMAASHMTWHIGNVSGRASSFGYNNYNTCFATENFTMGPASMTISQIAASWGDATHMIPATSSKYCHIGAGVATASDGMVYFVVQAAYPGGVNGCGYASGTGNYAPGADNGVVSGGIIMSVVTSTPDANGSLIHTVQEGQTLWAISQAYDVSIEDLQAWNNMYNSTALSLNQNLFIPSKDQAGHTPTPQIELTVFPTADETGRYVHIVSEGDTLWSISELWHVPLNSLYQANGMNENSSIGLGWDIIIPVTATVTPLPTDTPTPTPLPTETEIPTETPEAAESTQENQNSSQTNSLLHAPKASAQTWLVGGTMLLIFVGIGSILISIFMKKK